MRTSPELSRFVGCVALLVAVVVGCGDDDGPASPADAGRSDSSITIDGGGSRDAGPPLDADPAHDLGPDDDAGTSDDAGTVDDAGTIDDAGTRDDAGTIDAGRDGGLPTSTCAVDGDCPGGICWLAPDGARRCTMRVEPFLDDCDGSEIEPCCMSDADCSMAAGGRCAPFSFMYCGGPAPLPGNTCRYDGCASDADCTGGLCLPPGALGNLVSECAAAPCRSPADCDRGAGGWCVLTRVGGFCASPAIYCVYDGDPCVTDADCRRPDRSQICVPNPDGHGTRCIDEPPPPP